MKISKNQFYDKFKQLLYNIFIKCLKWKYLHFGVSVPSVITLRHHFPPSPPLVPYFHHPSFPTFVWYTVMWCIVMWCIVMWCIVTTSPPFVKCIVVWCIVMWCIVMWCIVVWHIVLWCIVVWCIFTTSPPFVRCIVAWYIVIGCRVNCKKSHP